ncbi:MAG: hypothetical protein HHJ17_08635 [Rhodoferax sp.]|uniref:hypothetical protein n=1 Tax=Rhodoferax sp. TaxID=50421 RepID=UPI0017DBF6C3|nr:hypothetical protein [Rhodoferax sp.]NMM13587.1 hypothetical protein [Rhodoferax sp.]
MIKISGALGALSARRNDDLQSRRLADIILTPEDLAGKTSAARLLQTTLGGVVRHITNKDLDAFKRNAKALGSKMRTGLTAAEVIDLSRPADLERARKEIRSSIAARLHKGEMMFVTPSGPDSKVSRHFVSVVFPGFGGAVAHPGNALQAAAQLVKSPLKLDCDCEHWRYRLRYIVTAMGANAARPENGYPKLTNPQLVGVACKHVLRTMVELQGSLFVRKQIAKMIDADRSRLTPGAKTRVITVSRAEADKVSQGRVRTVRTTNEKYAASIRKAMPKASADTSTAAELASTIAALQKRSDITSTALLQALQAVMQQYPTGK